MADSKIEWTESTWNPVVGCTKVSAGCANCYAERMAVRQGYMEEKRGFSRLVGNKVPIVPKYTKVANKKGWTGEIVCDESALKIPLHWRNPRRIFVCSMGDLFLAPFEFIDKVIATIELCQQHTHQILTKRPERMLEYFTSDEDARSESINDAIEKFTGGHLASSDMVEDFCKRKGITLKFRERLNYNENIWVNRHWRKPLWPAPHIWLGVTVEHPDYKNRIDILRQISAAVRFISIEPCLADMGELDLTGIHQVIVGGESGPGARYCQINNIRSVVRQCRAANVPVFVKQIHLPRKSTKTIYRPQSEDFDIDCVAWGFYLSKDMSEWPEDLRIREYPK